ncbi:d-ribulose-5-phosphate 3 epimerase [Mycoplasmopsis maculosa]|uniref:D-ribulose-5-phosphate 3 epimerase n=1 Tax=Mycoplasmopsis maculosa TaxID=114885 RepID=A0A449B4H4_9BACT|nr:ribulose-phosphate 3-epimerase [Mycoplasmopsis maculosa]VEU75492.1 d-ribulose-5-phosphate 3 epimerase [Mycoplasmopsis maculosa]
MKNKYVTPSLLNVEKKDRLEMANTLVEQGIKWIHYDVMDGKFVPNLAIELEEIKNINENGKKHLKDAHLMVENPLELVELYKDIVDITTFHYEAVDHFQLLEFLKNNQHDYRIGVAIKPATKVEEIKELLPYLQLVLVMSVEPGAGGQKFMPEALDKIKELKRIRDINQFEYLIQVDGGINNITGPQCFKAGADACVAGTFIVKNPTKETIQSVLGE